MKLSILHKGLLIVSIPLLFEVFFVMVLVDQIDKTSDLIKLENRSLDIIISIENILKEVADSTCTAIIYNASRKPEILLKNIESRENLNTHMARLLRLTKNDKEERVAAAKMVASARSWSKNQEKAIEGEPQKNISSFFAVRDNNQMQTLMELGPNGASKVIFEKEREVQSKQPRLLKQSIFQIQILLLFGAIVNITITIFLAAYFARYIAARLKNVLTNTYKLGARMELNPPLRGDDEIALLDQTLHESASEIIEFETFKEQLIGVVSHELRTPLTSIQGTMTLLQAGVLGDYPRPMLEEIEKVQSHLAKLINLVNDLLLVERLESGSQVLKKNEADLREVLEEAYEQAREIFKEAHEKTIVSGEKTEVLIDRNLLSKAFCILFLITQERLGGRRETLVIVDEKSDGINIIFEDNGVVIPKEKYERFFSRQAIEGESESSYTNVLSKSLLKAIITAHGGSLSIDSREESTKFTVTLPYRRRKDA